MKLGCYSADKSGSDSFSICSTKLLVKCLWINLKQFCVLSSKYTSENESKLILLLQYSLSSFRGAVQTEIPLWSEDYKNILKMCPGYGLSCSMLWRAGMCQPCRVFHRPGWKQEDLSRCVQASHSLMQAQAIQS